MHDSTVPNLYGPNFYGRATGAARSANLIIPLLLSCARISSVVDVGCGTGSWLAEFVANGVNDVLGIDGAWVETTMLKIPADRFIAHDLTLPISVERRFDLALCLEVAEHLAATRAPGLVRDLTQFAPCVMFSAAIPGQGGTGHVNEQFLSYWVELFSREGFLPVDLIRPTIWENDNIEHWWYKQNIMIFAAPDHPILSRGPKAANNYIHPQYVQQLTRKLPSHPITVGELIAEFPHAVARSLRSRWQKITEQSSK